MSISSHLWLLTSRHNSKVLFLFFPVPGAETETKMAFETQSIAAKVRPITEKKIFFQLLLQLIFVVGLEV